MRIAARATTNDKPLLAEFPYLAEPWPAKAQAPAATGVCMPIIIAVIVVVTLVGLVVWLLIRLCRKWAKG